MVKCKITGAGDAYYDYDNLIKFIWVSVHVDCRVIVFIVYSHCVVQSLWQNGVVVI